MLVSGARLGLRCRSRFDVFETWPAYLCPRPLAPIGCASSPKPSLVPLLLLKVHPRHYSHLCPDGLDALNSLFSLMNILGTQPTDVQLLR
eukprot:3272609-Pyramimonas_sp.AAC.1